MDFEGSRTSKRTVVSDKRWAEAQEYELDGWRRQNAPLRNAVQTVLHLFRFRKAKPGDDWNYWWRERFDGYEALPSRFERAIELGCGPYTNMRLIGEHRTIDHLYCSDPLANEYVKLRGRWLATEHANGSVIVDDHAIEECPYPDEYFDLVVLVNVLDHVRDAMKCLRTAIRITKPSGFFVFGQDLTDDVDLLRAEEDVGHPIRVRREDIEPWTRRSFHTVLCRTLPREEGRNPRAHCGTFLVIGTKLLGGEQGNTGPVDECRQLLR